MACRIATIADALVTWLNDAGRSWPLTGWTAVRDWVPRQTLEDLGSTLLVEVIPDEPGPVEDETRYRVQQDITVFVVVRQRYATAGAVPAAWIDARAELVEAIGRQVRTLELTGQPTGYQVLVMPALDAVETLLVDRPMLDEMKVYMGQVAVKFREYRPRVL